MGPNDLANQQTFTGRRDTGVKNPIFLTHLEGFVYVLLESIQSDMFNAANEANNSRIMAKWDDVVLTLDDKNIAVIPGATARRARMLQLVSKERVAKCMFFHY
jgi:hypothetical protein